MREAAHFLFSSIFIIKGKDGSMNKKIITAIYIILIFPFLINARDWRVQQIPNGSKFSCANCHVSAAGGGPRNAFGQAVAGLVSVGGSEQFWSSALASADSDGDGKSNGSELGDPAGSWRPGQANPGNFSLVTNPGNAASVAVTYNNPGMPNQYALFNNYPNPFNPATRIAFSLPRASRVTITIYNLIGQKVASLLDNEIRLPGIHSVPFNASGIPSGTYIYKMETPEFYDTKKMILLK